VSLVFSWTDLAVLVANSDSMARPEGEALTRLGPELVAASDGLAKLTVDGVSRNLDIPTIATGAPATDEVVLTFAPQPIGQGAIRLDFPVLAKMPFGHRMAVTLNDEGNVVGLLDDRNSTWERTLDAPGTDSTQVTPAARPKTQWAAFILLGIEHILTGFDHLCFLLALLLVAARLKDVFAVVTTFTLAHSITLAAAATGLVSLSPRIVEPLIAASIVYIGVENLILRRTPRYRLALVFGFGLVHGLGFASALGERLPGVTGWAIVPPLLSFNLGVELGQLAVAGLLVPLIYLARRRPSFSVRWQPAASLAIAMAGAVWFYQRV
jgi:hydrogenase/urease accessory protein HupE